MAQMMTHTTAKFLKKLARFSDRGFMIGMILSFLCFASFNISAQNKSAAISKTLEEFQQLRKVIGDEKALDSLRSFYPHFQQGRNLDQLYKLTSEIVNLYIVLRQADSSVIAYETCMEIARKLKIDSTEYKCGTMRAQTFHVLGDDENALKAYRSLITGGQELPYFRSMALQGYANFLFRIDNKIDSSYWYLEESQRIAREINDSVRLGSILENYAELNYYQGKYLSSIDNNIASIAYLTKEQDLKKFILMLRVGETFFEIDELERSYEYGLKSLNFGIEKEYKLSIPKSQLLLARILIKQGHYIEADSLISRVINTELKKPFNRIHLEFLLSRAENNLLMNKANAALLTLDTIYAHPKYMLEWQWAKYYQLKGQTELINGRLSEAQKALEKAFLYAKKLESPVEILPTLALQSEVKAAQGDFKGAYYLNKQFQLLKDSVFQIRQSQMLFDTEARYKRTEQDKTISFLNAQNDLKDLRLKLKNRQFFITLLGLFIVLVATGSIYFLYRNKKKLNSILAEKNEIISRALKEKDLLLREIHHRVKNNLQVISSLLSLQSRFIEDERALEAIKEGKNRVKSMALIHQNLYQEDNLMGVDIKPYFEKLIHSLFNSYNIDQEKIRLKLDVEPLNLDVETVIPIGLIVNELVSNALKHAFPGEMQGEIRITLSEQLGQLKLEVSDNGIGIKDIGALEVSNTFGYRMVSAFKEKLEADFAVENNNGTVIKMTIRDFKKTA